MDTYDVAIVGGGIFGCSIARHLAVQSDLDVALIEKENHLAQHQSGRNSGTLHPGLALDLKPGTRKATFAIEGGRKLREYCETRDLPIRNEGLMVVGTTEAECERLEAVYDRASGLGIDLSWLDEDEITEKEPHITGTRALYTRDSSTVLTADITYELANEAWNAGVEFYMGCRVTGAERGNDHLTLSTNKGDIRAEYLVNAAGVWAPELAKKLGFAAEYDLVPFRGQYYELVSDKRDRINTNVYPTSMPPRVPNSVGVHFTRRPDNKVIVGPTGMIALGPDTYGSANVDIGTVLRTLSSSRFWKFIGSTDTLKIAWTELNKTYRKGSFLKHCQRLMPDISSSDITKSYVGISHYLVDGSGSIQQDSVFERGPASMHILRPKPGLTSSLSIGEYVATVVREQFDGNVDHTEPLPSPTELESGADGLTQKH